MYAWNSRGVAMIFQRGGHIVSNREYLLFLWIFELGVNDGFEIKGFLYKA